MFVSGSFISHNMISQQQTLVLCPFPPPSVLVLPTLNNLHLHPRPISLIRRQILNLPQNSMSLGPHNPPKNNMLIIQKLCPRTRNKKLTPIRILARIRHTQ